MSGKSKNKNNKLSKTLLNLLSIPIVIVLCRFEDLQIFKATKMYGLIVDSAPGEKGGTEI